MTAAPPLAILENMNAMPVMLATLCILAIAYRYYSAFLAAKVAVLDDTRATPAQRLNDGHNYHPTNRWVLFGHHFAAISGAGPLIGPVLAAQFGYLPELLWIVIGVCLAGAVQDFLVLAASIRRNGKSLAQIAMDELGPLAGWAAMIAILCIVIVALAGLGKAVVQALAGDEIRLPAHSALAVAQRSVMTMERGSDGSYVYQVPAGTGLLYSTGALPIDAAYEIKSPIPLVEDARPGAGRSYFINVPRTLFATRPVWPLPAGAMRVVPGSSWGTFTIACTIPIALLVGFYLYRVRKGRILEASLGGAALTLLATVAGGWVAQSGLAHWFNLTSSQLIWAMAIYGFVASVLPVWFLLCPRDYLSSFLKIGTIAILVVGTLLANPPLLAPAVSKAFIHGGPIVGGSIFPFLFITIMCGAISGFHALVSSGTTPKMIMREGDARMIGYGAMLIEGLVGVVAMIAAATLAPADYYAINTDVTAFPKYESRLVEMGWNVDHLAFYDDYTKESLRGRTGGAVTLAVGMAKIFDATLGKTIPGFWKYWYHFAIMFEALFILTTIDTGTRIGRFLLQEMAGRIHPPLGRVDSIPGTIVSSLIIVAGWGYFIRANSFSAIWSMFGVANQMLAVIALAVVSAVLAAERKMQYLWVTLLPLAFVLTTTTTAAMDLFYAQWTTIRTQLGNAQPDHAILVNSLITGSLIAGMLLCAYTILIASLGRCLRGTLTRREDIPAVVVEPA
jgi:carbon starvation protein